MKDLILVPRWEVKNVECWPVQEINIGNDHVMVICQLNRREGLAVGVRCKAEKRPFRQSLCGQLAQPKVNVHAKLRRLDLHPHPDKEREYVSSLGDNLRSEPGDWKKTEQVMRQSALKILPLAEEPMEESWLTTDAISEGSEQL